ncbi:hypothetical protein PMIN05_007200 [Paraphaeosphaeria minitans]
MFDGEKHSDGPDLEAIKKGKMMDIDGVDAASVTQQQVDMCEKQALESIVRLPHISKLL